MKTIYLDHNATTPTRPEVVEAMRQCYADGLANPASQHQPGQQARRLLEDAREQIAAVLGVDLAAPRRDRLIFTSGGTEANNLAVLGISRGQGTSAPSQTQTDPPSSRNFSGHIVISAGEHQSVIEPAEHLLEQGWRMDTLGLTPDGVVRIDQLASFLKPDTRLVSVLLGNHETGVLQPIEELSAICSDAGVPLHTDAVQVVGKRPVDFGRLGAAAMSVAAHKFGGPVGIGALAIRQDVPLQPLLFGGHQQSGVRPGTEPVALAVGMAVALKLRNAEQHALAQRLSSLRDRFEQGLRAAAPGIVVHGVAAPRLPQTSNIAFPGLDGEVLRMALDLAGVACSVGAACASGSTELSPTLRAMQMPNELVTSSLRFSLGATTTEADIDEAVRRIASVASELRSK
ncbi:MAG: cysteine desulfurase family protein [Thermoguttaceae bacterium]